MPFPERIGPASLSASNAVLFTANRPIVAIHILLTNTDTVTRAVTINIVPIGGTLAQSNRVIAAFPMLANDTRTFTLKVPLVAGDTIQGLAAAAGVVNYVIVYSDDARVLYGAS